MGKYTILTNYFDEQKPSYLLNQILCYSGLGTYF